jgi:CxxC-x17-CxxC domain-containing protein
MNLVDKHIRCRDCGLEFIFTAGEQGFYIEKGLLNEPQRCGDCRANRRREKLLNAIRETTTVVCASCGGDATVPFVPRHDRPVYCTACFAAQRETALTAVS